VGDRPAIRRAVVASALTLIVEAIPR
jgi:hypothetical protein